MDKKIFFKFVEKCTGIFESFASFMQKQKTVNKSYNRLFEIIINDHFNNSNNFTTITDDDLLEMSAIINELKEINK